jgi:tRNA-Thr(GGU) m(6)t(6)A37 methyltransferase TsaA
MTKIHPLLVPVCLCCALGCVWSARPSESPSPAPENPIFAVQPIGRIEKQGDRTFVRLDSVYEPGLRGLEKWSHIWVFYWFDRNDSMAKRKTLLVHPRGNPQNPLTGVFATRSPVRPNLVALSLCRILSITNNVIELNRIDAFDGTPVVDLKPYIRSIDQPDAPLSEPDWLKPKPPATDD